MVAVVGIIPARGNSKRLPYKNIAELGGEPLVIRAARIASQSRLDAVYVSTEDIEIRTYASMAGYNVIDRPAELAQDHILTQSVLAHAAESLAGFDYVMCLQPDVPFRTAATINAALDLLERHRPEMLLSYKHLGQMPVTLTADGHVAVYDGYLDRARYHIPAGVLEAYRVDVLRNEAWKRATDVIAYVPERSAYAVDIDTLGDLELANALLPILTDRGVLHA